MTRHLDKRSMSLGGHRTSVALEPAFWSVLARVASRRGESLAELVARIDAGRDPAVPLASVLRLFALDAASRLAIAAENSLGDVPVKPP